MLSNDESPEAVVRRLLALGLDDTRAADRDDVNVADDPPVGSVLGDYELVGRLGRGGMGGVYEARSTLIGQRVAVKVLLSGDWSTPAERRRFLFDAEAAATLNHPNVIRVLHVGEQEKKPYFVMPLVAGGSLERRIAERNTSGRPAFDDQAELLSHVGLVATVARAVHHAHERGLLHRDLKPANILLGAQGEPYVADFGLAMRMDAIASYSAANERLGTLAYMAREQALGDRNSLTVRTDVYGLGAILHDLLTGRPPFEAPTYGELLELVTGPEPVGSLRSIDPRIPPALEAVCLKALEKEPSRRYDSAAELASDLESIALGRATSLPPLSSFGRFVHWIRRNPKRSRQIARSGLVFLGVAVAVAIASTSALRAERAALSANMFVASAQAGAVLFQLREYADRLQSASEDERIVALVRSEKMAEPPELFSLATGFDRMFVLSTDGRLRAQWPVAPRVVRGLSYEFRDYFVCAKALSGSKGRGPCMARAFRSEGDGQVKFGLSTPLFERGAWVGVLVAVLAADSIFGKVQMNERAEGGYATALLGPLDAERDPRTAPAPPGAFVYLVHEGLARGTQVLARAEPALVSAARGAGGAERQFELPHVAPTLDAHHLDPFPGFEGEWLAAFAPVGRTGYVVAVETRRPFVRIPFASREGS